MNTIASFCGISSVVIGVFVSVPYWRAILAGRTKPHQLSWLVFTIMNAIVALSQFLEGARLSVLISVAFFVGSTVNFLLAFSYGVRDTSKYDRWLFTFSLLTIAMWVLTKSNALAIWLTVVIDVFATAMIFLKVWYQPDSEDYRPWALATLAFGLSTASLANKPLSILWVRPLYGVVSAAVIVFAVLWPRRLIAPTIITSAPTQQ